MWSCASEQALRPSEARTHGAGLVLAESVVGVSHGLHSKAAILLPLLLSEDLLDPASFTPTSKVP